MLLSVATVAAALAAGLGVGYTVTNPVLGDGSAFLPRGHGVVHVNGETGHSDAEVALQLATGTEQLQTVRLPDGRLVVVNKSTGAVTYLDGSTLTPSGTPPPAPSAEHKSPEALATSTDGYLVNQGDDTVTQIPAPGKTAPEPVRVRDGVKAAVPAGEAAWVLTEKGDVVEIVAGQVRRTIPLGEAPAAITVADGHPVVLMRTGTAYVVDGEQLRSIGSLGISGADLVAGSWRGAGRYALAVDRQNRRLVALDPRTGHLTTVNLKTGADGDLGSPVMLDDLAYVPDYAGHRLWRVDLATGKADQKPVEVPGKGEFSLEVAGGRVWANDQYHRRAVLLDPNGNERYVDKGAAPVVSDFPEPPGQPGEPKEAPPDSPPAVPAEPPSVEKKPEPDAERVEVPAFPPGTSYQDACARLEELRLTCRPVAGGDGGDAGDVIGTDPSAGASVPVRSRVIVRYVGPTMTPPLSGLSRAEACRAIQAAKLVCAERPDATPATSPDLLERVSRQDPTPGTAIRSGDTVTIRYPNTIALPSFTGQTQGEACARLQQYRMNCQAAEGLPAVGPGQTAGAVYAQNPAAQAVAKVGDSVQITYYSGDGVVGAYVDSDISAACASVQAAGFTCEKVDGVTAAGTGKQPGTVYDQSHSPGTKLTIGATVTLTYYGGSNSLPSFVGQDVAVACVTILAHGFLCNPQVALHPTSGVNKVFDQNPAGGIRAPIGTVVTVYFSPWAQVSYWKYLKNDDEVWVLRPEGQIPAGYGRRAEPVGVAYGAWAAIPSPSYIHGFYCTLGGTSCNGLPVNHFYTRAVSYDAGWVGPTPAATFMKHDVSGTCTAGRPIWRTWNSGSPRYYDIVADPGNAEGRELLGCVW